MRAFVVEFAGADDTAISGVLEGRATDVGSLRHTPSLAASGHLVGEGTTTRHDPEAGEPV